MTVSDFEERKLQLCKSFDAVAEAMCACAQIASSFSKYVAGLPADVVNTAVPQRSPVDTDGKHKRKRADRVKKDPDAPKRPTSAYIHFQNEVRAGFKEKFPGQPYIDVVNEIAKEWKSLLPEQKVKYNQMVIDDKKRYETETREYNIKKGLDPEIKVKTPTARVKKIVEQPTPDATEKETEATSHSDSTDAEDGSDDEETAAAQVTKPLSDEEDSDEGDDDDDEEEHVSKKSKQVKDTISQHKKKSSAKQAK